MMYDFLFILTLISTFKPVNHSAVGNEYYVEECLERLNNYSDIVDLKWKMLHVKSRYLVHEV